MSRFVVPALLALLSLEALSIDSAQAFQTDCDRHLSSSQLSVCVTYQYTPPLRGLPQRRGHGGSR